MIKIEVTVEKREKLLEMTLPTEEYRYQKEGQIYLLTGPFSVQIERVICEELDFENLNGIVCPNGVALDIQGRTLTVFNTEVPNFHVTTV